MEKDNATMQAFCERFRDRLGATGCLSFSGRVESVVALLDRLELGGRDCVYLSALAPGEVVRGVLASGASAVLCDVTPDGLTMDYRALETMVKKAVAGGHVYPRAVIADHFGGVPFAARAIKSFCDRMGLILIEDCGDTYGGSADGAPCGTIGDYALFSMGRSSVFGTGGTGSLLVIQDGTLPCDRPVFCDGGGYQTADEIYAAPLLASLDRIDEVLASVRASAERISAMFAESDFWLQRSGGRQISSHARLTLIGQSEQHSARAVSLLESAGLGHLVRRVHVHNRDCFKAGCGGFKNPNGQAVAPRAFSVDLFGALHAGETAVLEAQMAVIAERVREE